MMFSPCRALDREGFGLPGVRSGNKGPKGVSTCHDKTQYVSVQGLGQGGLQVTWGSKGKKGNGRKKGRSVVCK
jgi:hypothetical protein